MQIIEYRPRYLTLLMILYILVYITANWFDPKLINIFGLVTGGGALIFPLTYLLSDIITEVYGYKVARLTVWMGISFSLAISFYGQFIAYLPSPDYDQAYTNFVSANFRIMLASAISYLLTETLNSYIVAKLKVILAGKFIGIRFFLSTMSAHALSVIIFCSMAFYGTMSNENLLFFMISSWTLMVCIGLVLLAVIIRLAIALKKIEQLDIYDRNTAFNIFSLNTEYAVKDNQFNNK